MVRPRAWVRRATVAVAAATVLAVGVSSSAQAFAPPPVPPVVVGGAVTTAAEVITTAAGIGAGAGLVVGGLAAVVVGVGLYATRDTWVPWVRGVLDFIGGHSLPAGAHPLFMLPLTVTESAVRIDYQAAYAGAYGFGHIYVDIVCHQTGTNGWTSKTELVQVYATLEWYGQTETRSPINMSCAAGSTIEAVQTRRSDDSGGPFSNYEQWSSGKKPADAVKYRARVNCRATDGTLSVVESINLGAELGGPGFVLPSCEEHGAGIGSVGTGVTVDTQMPGSTRWDRVYEAKPTPGTQYTECDPAFGKACKLEVLYKGQPCQVGSNACVDWTERYREAPEDYACRWGQYVMPISSCNMLERTYRPGGSQLTPGNTDGRPETVEDLNPDGSPKTGTGTSPGTGWDGKVSEMPDTAVPETSPNGDPSTEGGNCYPTGTAAWNPLEWVMRPVQCALVWAFVPDTGTVTQTKTQIQAALDATGIPAIGARVGDAFGGLEGQGGSGCRGPGFTFPLDKKEYYLLDACSGAMAQLAGGTHAFGLLVVTLGGGYAFIRVLAGAFGYTVRLGGGGDE